jgi:hypothetical protein
VGRDFEDVWKEYKKLIDKGGGRYKLEAEL